MTPQAGWYPVALAGGLEPGTSTGTRLFGKELVVWRDDAGQSHVWEDRCPHRGMRLSFGFVRGGHIACLYHGWQFDSAGQCRSIPAHPDIVVPPSIRVTGYTSAERLGFVWVYSGEAGEAPPPPGDNADTVPVRSLAIEAPADAVLATLRAAPSPFDAKATTEGSAPLLTMRAGEQALVAAVQPVSARETTLHFALVGAPDTYRGAGQARISSWSEALRRKTETAPALEIVL